MNNATSNAFTMNGIFYIFDRQNYLQYDGTTVQAVEPYVPATRISSAPDGTGGVTNQQHNLIGAGFENWFSGDGVATVYTLTLGNLDATAIVASTDGGTTYDKVETTDFTVNRTTGDVTWIAAQGSGTNNVRIRAFRTVSGNADKIKKSAGHHAFGGANDTHVWVWNEHRLYRCDTLRPNYFPENDFQPVGTENEDIMGMVTQYNTAVIYKTYSIWLLSVEDNGTTISYPVRPLNGSVGCQAPGSIQILNNNAVSFTDTGIYELVASNVRDERNVDQQSRRVDDRLLREPNRSTAVSVDTGNTYLLCINQRAYVWDYQQPQQDQTQRGEWYYWTNIPASCFYQEGTDLYMGDNLTGLIHRFTTTDDGNDQYADDGAAIEAFWRSRIEYLGQPERRKTIKNVWVTIQPYSRTSASISYYDESGGSGAFTELGGLKLSIFSYDSFRYSDFSYNTSTIPQTGRFKAKIKKVQTFQVEVSNNLIYERLGVLSMQWEYDYKSKVKQRR
jgi:hypothetical protein